MALVLNFFLLGNTQLVLEWGIGTAVFARCLLDKIGTEDQIVNNLGSGFPATPFAIVVVCYSQDFLQWTGYPIVLQSSDILKTPPFCHLNTLESRI